MSRATAPRPFVEPARAVGCRAPSPSARGCRPRSRRPQRGAIRRRGRARAAAFAGHVEIVDPRDVRVEPDHVVDRERDEANRRAVALGDPGMEQRRTGAEGRAQPALGGLDRGEKRSLRRTPLQQREQGGRVVGGGGSNGDHRAQASAARARDQPSATFGSLPYVISGEACFSITSSLMITSFTDWPGRVVHDVEQRALEDRAQAARAALLRRAPCSRPCAARPW